MRFYTALYMIVFIFACSSVNNFDKKTLQFEIKLAETEPDSSLDEMTFYNSTQKFYVHDSVYLTNRDIASTEIIDWTKEPKVLVTLTDDGQEKFAEFTKKNINKHAAMIVDDKLISAPRVNGQIKQGKLIIVGYYNHDEAKSIAAGIVSKYQE